MAERALSNTDNDVIVARKPVNARGDTLRRNIAGMKIRTPISYNNKYGKLVRHHSQAKCSLSSYQNGEAWSSKNIIRIHYCTPRLL